jgi:hypothetical protein
MLITTSTRVAMLGLLFATGCQLEPENVVETPGRPMSATETSESTQRIDRNYPPLIDAILADDVNAVRLALKAGGDPSKPVQKITPLGWSLDGLRCSPEVIRLLAESGADLEALVWPSDISPLVLALHHSRYNPACRECVDVLLEFGADIHRKDRLGGNSIHAAVNGGLPDMVSRFAALGVDVNTVTSTGYTALLFAAARGEEPMVRRLLELGADPCVANPDGYTAAYYARNTGLAQLSRDLQDICTRRGKH